MRSPARCWIPIFQNRVFDMAFYFADTFSFYNLFKNDVYWNTNTFSPAQRRQEELPFSARAGNEKAEQVIRQGFPGFFAQGAPRVTCVPAGRPPTGYPSRCGARWVVCPAGRRGGGRWRCPMGGLPSLSPANLAFGFISFPHPPPPFPAGRGLSYFHPRASPLASP